MLLRVWIQNFCLMPAEAGAQRGMNGPGEDGMLVRWRTAAEGFPASPLMLASPYDADVQYAKKRNTTWIGYKVHLTETCDDERPHLITHVETTPAPVVDRDAVGPVHESLAAKGLLPGKHLVDTGYVDADQGAVAKVVEIGWRVESRKGAVAGCAGPVSLPRSSNRTCRSPASGFPTGFVSGTRRRAKVNPAKPKHAEFAEHRLRREAGDAARRHLVAPDQEVADILIDMVVDRPVSRPASSMVEVGAPAPQQAVQPGAYFRPRGLVAWRQSLVSPHLQPLHALLRRACA